MIHEAAPVTNQYISVPPDLGHLNCAAYVAGVAAGILDGANFVSFSFSILALIPFQFACYCTACLCYCTQFPLHTRLVGYIYLA
jgi:hypothetical protein